jgi:hypothetical protein
VISTKAGVCSLDLRHLYTRVTGQVKAGRWCRVSKGKGGDTYQSRLETAQDEALRGDTGKVVADGSRHGRQAPPLRISGIHFVCKCIARKIETVRRGPQGGEKRIMWADIRNRRYRRHGQCASAERRSPWGLGNQHAPPGSGFVNVLQLCAQVGGQVTYIPGRGSRGRTESRATSCQSASTRHFLSAGKDPDTSDASHASDASDVQASAPASASSLGT